MSAIRPKGRKFPCERCGKTVGENAFSNSGKVCRHKCPHGNRCEIDYDVMRRMIKPKCYACRLQFDLARANEQANIASEQTMKSKMRAANLCVEDDVDEPRLRCGVPLPCPRHPRPAKRDADFLCGFAVALATLVRTHDEPTKAADIARSNGFALEDFVQARVEDYDLRELRKAFA